MLGADFGMRELGISANGSAYRWGCNHFVMQDLFGPICCWRLSYRLGSSRYMPS